MMNNQLPTVICLLPSVLRIFTTVEMPLQISSFMQNKPNFDKGQNKPNPLYKKDLRKFYTPSDNEKRTQNKPNTKPIKANLLDAQMNVKSFHTVEYENKSNWTLGENKPNSNPIKANTKPIKANKIPKQSQYKPKQTQFQRQKNAQARVSHYFKQFEKKLVTARQSRDYLENREKDKRNKSFSFS
jgi:hypothetical protein